MLVAPGRVGDWSMAGSLALLRETPARPLVGLDEMVEDLGYLDRATRDGRRPASRRQSARAKPALAMLGATERAVAQRLCDGPAGLDLLVAETGLPPGGRLERSDVPADARLGAGRGAGLRCRRSARHVMRGA